MPITKKPKPKKTRVEPPAIEEAPDRQCTRCYRIYAPTEIACPDCKNPEFMFPSAETEPMSSAGRNGEARNPAAAAGDTVLLPIASITPSPTNPRKFFDPEQLDKLATSFKNVGIIENLVVRRVGDAYELIAGERRYRAAKLAKLREVPCKIVDVTDEEALEIQFLENWEREELNPIEEGIAFQQLTTAGGPFTQTALAKRLNISQGQIANRIRLLELPDEWRQRVISREMPPTHARELLPWVKYPGILQALESRAKDLAGMSIDRWKETIRDAVRQAGRSMDSWQVQFKATPERIKELNVVEFKASWGQKFRYALNVELYDRLQAEAIERRRAREEKAAKKAAATDGKASAAEQEEKQRKAAEQFAKRLYRYRVAWLQSAIAERLDEAPVPLLLKLLLFFGSRNDGNSQRSGDLFAMIEQCGGKRSTSRDGFLPDMWPSLTSLPLEQMERLAREALKRWVAQPVIGYYCPLHYLDVEAIAAELGVDIQATWSVSEEFLLLHTVDQLKPLIAEWRLDPRELGKTRSQIAASILDRAGSTRLPCPRELVKCKPVEIRW